MTIVSGTQGGRKLSGHRIVPCFILYSLCLTHVSIKVYRGELSNKKRLATALVSWTKFPILHLAEGKTMTWGGGIECLGKVT